LPTEERTPIVEPTLTEEPSATAPPATAVPVTPVMESPVPSATAVELATADSLAVTATAMVVAATEIAQARAASAAALGLSFPVPQGWSVPDRLNANSLYLNRGDVRLFIYRGDATYMQQNWGIPAGATLDEAASALADYVGEAEIVPYESERARLIQRPKATPLAGVIYLVELEGDEWVIVSANLPLYQVEAVRAETLDPLVANLKVIGPVSEYATPTPAPLPTGTGGPSPILMTATQVILEATKIAAGYASRTPIAPSATPTPVPSATPTEAFNYGATATLVIQTATAAAEMVMANTPLPDLSAVLPEGWRGPIVASTNSVLFTDGAARMFIYFGDAAYFETVWQIPAGADVAQAAEAIAGRVGGSVAEFADESVGRIDVMSKQTVGALYVIRRENSWMIVSASTPHRTFTRYAREVFEPVVRALAE